MPFDYLAALGDFFVSTTNVISLISHVLFYSVTLGKNKKLQKKVENIPPKRYLNREVR